MLCVWTVGGLDAPFFRSVAPLRRLVCVLVCLLACLSVCLSVCWLVCLFVCLCVCLPACLPACLPCLHCLPACLPGRACLPGCASRGEPAASSSSHSCQFGSRSAWPRRPSILSARFADADHFPEDLFRGPLFRSPPIKVYAMFLFSLI